MACTRNNIPLSSQLYYVVPNTSFPLQVRKNQPMTNCSPARACVRMSYSNPTSTPIVSADESLLKYVRRSAVLVPSEEKQDKGQSKRREYLLERTRREVQDSASRGTVEKLQLVDTIQRLGIGYYLEDDIMALLQDEYSSILHNNATNDDTNKEDLFTTALRFRLLRQNGLPADADVFSKFMDVKSGKFEECLAEDTKGLLSLYEASHLGAKGETILEEAQKFSKTHLQSKNNSADDDNISTNETFELPRHLRMERLEARRYILEYSKQNSHDPTLLELATLDYTRVQAQHQSELSEITRWWKQLGLVEKLSFARDRPLECFLWSVGLLPDPKYSVCRTELAKTIAILLVIDDIFDTYGKMDELVIFTDAIRRWDLDAIDTLPEYMKICYMALYNTTNEICYKVLKQNGWSVLPYLKSTWIDMIEGFMVEAKWFNGGSQPNLEEYIENGVSTAGAYMALVHLFFLIGDGVTNQNARMLKKPYPKLFSAAGRILRLWDDLGTAKEEQERGDLASSIQLLIREKNLASEEEGRDRILEEIKGLWKDLNGELISKNGMPLAIVKVALNMARASQVVYKHEEDTYFSSVDNYVEALFFTPLLV
ncbi:geraniol synthase [Striga asiatica]|uniref:Geraniol synthase n=1 Tax=Striga asiatica TaxID=4170 RepID=A0A5A7QYU8_STRAF|nr:geraniol synthase [Striga asiatica]